MQRLAHIALALLSASPGIAGAQAVPARPPVILAGAEARRLLAQCSRPSPEAPDSLWTPDSTQIARLEAGLATYLKDREWKKPGFGPTLPLARYRGQYIGLIRGRDSLVYASYSPADLAAHDSLFASRAAVWCDGGGRYFGLEYSLTTGKFAHLARNAIGQVSQ